MWGGDLKDLLINHSINGYRNWIEILLKELDLVFEVKYKIERLQLVASTWLFSWQLANKKYASVDKLKFYDLVCAII